MYFIKHPLQILLNYLNTCSRYYNCPHLIPGSHFGGYSEEVIRITTWKIPWTEEPDGL